MAAVMSWVIEKVPLAAVATFSGMAAPGRTSKHTKAKRKRAFSTEPITMPRGRFLSLRKWTGIVISALPTMMIGNMIGKRLIIGVAPTR